MALTARQEKLYVHTVDIYKPYDFEFEADNDVEQLVWPLTPTYSNVKCYREAETEFTQEFMIGRTNRDNVFFTVDNFHFDVAQPVGSNWAIQFKLAGHPDDGQWFICLGFTMVKNYRANKHSVRAKRVSQVAQR